MATLACWAAWPRHCCVQQYYIFSSFRLWLDESLTCEVLPSGDLGVPESIIWSTSPLPFLFPKQTKPNPNVFFFSFVCFFSRCICRRLVRPHLAASSLFPTMLFADFCLKRMRWPQSFFVWTQKSFHGKIMATWPPAAWWKWPSEPLCFEWCQQKQENHFLFTKPTLSIFP